jgi:UrcA family protein
VGFTNSNDAASPSSGRTVPISRDTKRSGGSTYWRRRYSTEWKSNIHLEIEMNTQLLNARSLFCIAVVAACLALSGPVHAESHDVMVKIPVSTAHLDLSQPAGATELYSRLREAAWDACREGGRLGLEPVKNFKGCYEQALGGAIRAANQPQLTLVYLKTHTWEEAATHGIAVARLVAAK